MKTFFLSMLVATAALAEAPRTIPLPANRVHRLAFLPGTPLLAVVTQQWAPAGQFTAGLSAYRTTDGARVLDWSAGLQNAAELAVSRDGRFVVLALTLEGRTVLRLWTVEQGALTARPEVVVEGGRVTALDFAPDSRRLFLSTTAPSQPFRFRTYDVVERRFGAVIGQEDATSVYRLRVLNDGRLATWVTGHNMAMWTLGPTLARRTASVRAPAADCDDERGCPCCHGGRTVYGAVETAPGGERVTLAADGRRLTIQSRGTERVRNLPDAAVTWAFAAAAPRIVAVAANGAVFVVDLGDARLVAEPRLGTTVAPQAAPALSADGRLLAVPAENGIHVIALP